MAILLTSQGEEAWLDLITAVNYTLRLFKNDVVLGKTRAQLKALTSADFIEATFPGYAAAALTGGSWTTNPGDPGVATYAQQAFIRSSTGTMQNIYGYYIVTTTGNNLRYFERLGGAGGYEMAVLNDEIRVTPRIPLNDDGTATS